MRLEVPESSRIDLDAESRRGEVRSDVKGLAAEAAPAGEPGRARRLSGKIGGGGSTVRLRADGDITLDSRPSAPPSAAQATPPPSQSATPRSPAEKP